MLRLVKHVLVVVLFVVFAGCSGGGCSSGCSCAGVTPLPAGFPPEKRVENAASLRLTDSGLNFLEQNLGSIAGLVLGDMGMGGIVTFEVPPTSQDIVVADADICPNGPNPAATPPECVAEIDLANAQLAIDTTTPHNIHVSGPLPIRIQKLPLKVTWFGFLEDNLEMVFNQGGNCPGAGQPFGTVRVDVDVSIEIDGDMSHSRYGYSRVRIGGFTINEDDILANIEYCDQNGVTGAILDALDSFFIGTLVDQITGTLQSSIEEQLCQRANPELNPPCPDGTTQDGDFCRYSDGSCASIILGLEGNIDLSGLLASFSPGTKGGFDFLLAAGGHSVRTGSTYHYGDLDPIGAGATLGMYGGTEPVPVSGCVPQVAVEPPQGIPIPDELVGNTLPDWPAGTEGPHVGFAISERFTNYMLTQLYNSGALCLGITPDALGPAVPLATSLVSVGLGAPSMEELGRLKESAPIAILLRPQAPPQATFGNGTDIETDPLIRLVLPKLSFDFYVWSLDRYIRMMTATMDLDVPVNLTVTPEGLVPEVQSLTVSNATVTNSQLLREEPAALAASLQALLGDLIGGFLGDVFPPINLNDALSSLGLTLEIPPSVEGQGSPGLRKLEKGRDRYLGFFGTIGFAPQMMSVSNPPPMPDKPPVSETTAELIDLHVDPAGLRIDGYRRDNGPKARIYAGSNLDNGGHAVEWQYKLDKGPWRPFTRERWIDIEDEWLRGQGRHLVHVRSRIVGEVHSLDPEPAVVEVIVDGEPPRIDVDQNAQGMLEVRAVDAVSGASRTRMRLRLGEGAPGEISWAAWSEWMEADDLPALDVDVDWVEVEAEDEEGHVATTVQPLIRGRADGEGCACTTPGRSGDEHGRWLLFAALLALLVGRRKRLPRVPVAGALLVLFGGMSGCSCGDDVASTDTCRGRGDCEVVLPGLIGAYGSAVVAPDGKLWVAGYLEASYDQDYFFGDLVVGSWNGSQVDWQAIDGVPTDPPVDPQRFDPQSFRGGQTEQGDDVGLWTSIAIAPDGNPAVAYYDATNRALRFAQRLPDGTWQVGEVQRVERGDVGRYAKLTFVGGQAHIAYLFIEPGEAGAVKSGVRLARGGGGWSFEDVVVDNATPCRHYFCGPGTACVIDTGLCTQESNDCAAACADGEECVDVGGMPTCSAIYDTGKLDTYPDAVGLYISLAQRPSGELAIGYYDRVHGNLMIAVQTGGMWTPQIVDGESNGTDTGDKGIGASLYVDKDDVFHMSYVDGLSESLNYVALPAGTPPGTVEVVDDGLSAGDGPHLVGDDSHIFVRPGGEVHISYQDATAGLLRVAVGTLSGAMHTWTTKTVEQEGFAGFFSRQIEFEGGVKVLNFWRVASPKAEGNVRLLTP